MTGLRGCRAHDNPTNAPKASTFARLLLGLLLYEPLDADLVPALLEELGRRLVHDLAVVRRRVARALGRERRLFEPTLGRAGQVPQGAAGRLRVEPRPRRRVVGGDPRQLLEQR